MLQNTIARSCGACILSFFFLRNLRTGPGVGLVGEALECAEHVWSSGLNPAIQEGQTDELLNYVPE
jgi:hypothetical protein